MLLGDFRAERPSGTTHRLGDRNPMSSCGNQEFTVFARRKVIRLIGPSVA